MTLRAKDSRIHSMKYKNNIIFTDCDGVCLDWEFGFRTWMQLHGHKLVNKDVYAVAEQFGLDKNAAKAIVRTFNESAAVGFLPPLRDAQYYIKKLAEKHQYKFIAVTSLSLDPFAQQLRKQNLDKLFGDDTFIDVICLDCGADKDDILAHLADKYGKGHWWVEDKPENVDAGINVGFKGILMEHGHNLDYSGDAKIAKNWKNICYDIIKEDGTA